VADVSLTRRQHTQVFDAVTTADHQFRLQPFRGIILEVEDEHFHHDSAVMLPNYPANAREARGGPSLGLSVIAICLKHQDANRQQLTLLTGHADTSGPDKYNLAISVKRANSVMHVLMGERDDWITVCEGQHKTEDYQLILKWVSDLYGWGCDPQGIDNVLGQHTKDAITEFQTRYNQEFEASIAVSGEVDHDTWGAFFDVYMDMIQDLCETDDAGLAQLRAQMNFLGPKLVGCGENWPIDQRGRDNYRSRINRRVEILFFDPGQEPHLDCHPGETTCTPVLCELYNPRMYHFTPLPVVPSPPKPRQVFLKLTYLGPENDHPEYVFPKDFPVTVTWGDASTHPVTVQQGGLLHFGVPQNQGPFTLQFDTADTFIAKAPAGSADPNPDRTAHAADLAALHTSNFRFFKVPDAWTLKQADWTPTAAPHYDATNFNFTLPVGRFGKTLGSTNAPEQLKLDPHWTYLRFEFFDRQFGHSAHNHKRVNTPAMQIDGFRSNPPAATPDTSSHWTIKDADLLNAVHAIPWILQFQADHTAEPKPDTQMQLEFTNAAQVHVISDSATVRRIAAVADPNDLKPGEERLKFYDLPNKWRSKLYFTRFADNTGDFFENLTQARIDASKTSATPLIFSLDDMVLADATFSPIVLAATEDPCLFFHQFKNPGAGVADKPISATGVYNPGADLTKQYFPYSIVAMTNRSYLSEYPNWIRVITAQGNLFDVFGQRMPDTANQVVGARAAVRWIDASTAAVGIQADGTVDPRPGRTSQPATDPFFVLQPFFSQRVDTNRAAARSAGKVLEWQAPFAGGMWTSGRLDMALLRDCDVRGADASGNGGTEIAVNLHYFRFWLDFNNAGAPLNVAANQQNFRRDVVNNIPVRWNGPDGTNNPTAPLLKPQDATKLIEIGIKWVVQDLPSGKEHFHITIPNPVPPDARANMNDAFGTGSYTPGAQADDGTGWFTAAHECGHGDSLLDEYNERWLLCSYQERSFATWIDGDPYEEDNDAMMRGNKQIRGRHYWHAVEWVRAASGLNFNLDHAGGIYKLPHHTNQSAADLRTFVNRPFVYEVNVTGANAAGEGARRKFDMYLYALGNDTYARLPAPGQDLRGILMIETKILVIFDDPNVTYRTIRNTVLGMARAADGVFSGMVASVATPDGSGADLSPCLLVFRPRFMVQTFPSNIANATDKNLQLSYCNNLGMAGVPNAEPAITQFLTNTAPGLYTTQFNTARTEHPEYFQVNVRSSYISGWNAGGAGSLMKLKAANEFAPFFGDMLGLDMTVVFPAAAVIKQRVQNRIVRRLMSNATVA
jgi:hypothetical protein